MKIVFVFIVLVLIFLLLHFISKNSKMKNRHLKEVLNLNEIIIDLMLKQKNQNEALQLAEDLNFKLQISRGIIDQKILNLQGELISKLAENRLID